MLYNFIVFSATFRPLALWIQESKGLNQYVLYFEVSSVYEVWAVTGGHSIKLCEL